MFKLGTFKVITNYAIVTSFNTLIMEWTFEDFKADLEDLTPEVRNRALEIAQKLMTEGGISEDEAIKKGIKRAEECFLDSGG